MAPKPTLTKSLHTITAVANVAKYLAGSALWRDAKPAALTAAALQVLGYDTLDFAKSDQTVQRCIAAVEKILSA